MPLCLRISVIFSILNSLAITLNLGSITVSKANTAFISSSWPILLNFKV
jgi:hypothetical protein